MPSFLIPVMTFIVLLLTAPLIGILLEKYASWLSRKVDGK